MEKWGNEVFGGIAEEILKRGSRLSFRASGASMSPFIKDGDTVVMAPVRDGVNVGDVVLVTARAGRLLLHRVVKKRKGGVVTRGDASINDDGCISWENIIGKVISVKGKGYNFHLKSPFKYMISRFASIRGLRRYSLITRFGKKIADVLG